MCYTKYHVKLFPKHDKIRADNIFTLNIISNLKVKLIELSNNKPYLYYWGRLQHEGVSWERNEVFDAVVTIHERVSSGLTWRARPWGDHSAAPYPLHRLNDGRYSWATWETANVIDLITTCLHILYILFNLISIYLNICIFVTIWIYKYILIICNFLCSITFNY